MGYDMYLVRKPDGEEDRVNAAREAWEVAVKARDAYVDAHPGAKGRHTKEEFESGNMFDAPANADPEYARLHAEQHQLYEEYSNAQTSYFRLNIFGMGACRDIMEELGMVTGNWGDRDDWPKEPEGYWDWLDAEDDHNPHAVSKWSYAQVKEFQAYREALAAYLSAGPTPATAMPMWKFCSNDGWLVRPDEITAALQTYRKVVEEDPDPDRVKYTLDRNKFDADYWNEWIAFLGRGVEYGGITVH